MPYGRGGAGNFYQAAEEKKKAAADVEAQPQPQSQPQSSPTASSQQQYAHSGRGGAGNWFSPATLAATGTFSSTPPSTSQQQEVGANASATPSASQAAQALSSPTSEPENTQLTQELPKGKMGRGGAGNMVWGYETQEERARRDREEKAREEEVRRSVMEDVELGLRGLKKPEGVVLRPEGRVGQGERDGDEVFVV